MHCLCLASVTIIHVQKKHTHTYLRVVSLSQVDFALLQTAKYIFQFMALNIRFREQNHEIE